MIRWFVFVLCTLLFLPAVGHAADASISGTVRSKDGKGLEGATIRVVGTALGAISKKNGSFVIPLAKAQDVTLNVTMIGFVQQTVTVKAGALDQPPLV
ncbi:MAG: carboxypeptidase-like regulatory domain-containing protein [Candidatus Kapaibacteriota bacterium]